MRKPRSKFIPRAREIRRRYKSIPRGKAREYLEPKEKFIADRRTRCVARWNSRLLGRRRKGSEERRFNLSKSAFSYEKDIDENLREIIRLLNKIPWLKTSFCCEGHKKTDDPRSYPIIEGYIMFHSFDLEKIEYELLPFLAKYLDFDWATEINIEMKKQFVLEKRDYQLYGWKLDWVISPASAKLKGKFLNSLELALRKFLKTKNINNYHDPSVKEAR